MKNNELKTDQIKRYKELYLLSKDAYFDEEDRFRKFEEKASRCLTAFTLFLGIYGFIFRRCPKVV